MTGDTAPFVYDFRYNYYENFYSQRRSEMSTSGSFYDMWSTAWLHTDSVKALDDGLGVGSVDINNGVYIRDYVKKYFNGDTPDCLTDKLIRGIKKALKYANPFYIQKLIFDAIKKFLKKLFGSFVCTATMDVLGTQCGMDFLSEMKSYRDRNMTDKEGVDMLKYYDVLGPKIVANINEDDDSHIVYQYIYAEYIDKLREPISRDDSAEVLKIYFRLIDDMVTRYDIKTIGRYKVWQQNLI